MSAQDRAVVFDFGKVIIDWDAARAVGHLFSSEDEARAELARIDFGAWNLEQDRGRSWADGFAAAPDARTRAIYEAYLADIDAAHAQAMPGTSDLVTRLHAKGVPLFGLTNAAREAVEACRRMHAAIRLMDDIVISADEGLLKPDAAIYHVLMDRTGRAPSDHVFIDDKADNVAAAEALGMRGHHFTGADALETFLTQEGLL
ncbi:MAG: HAD family phosphatase [Pseudomonadota bacterium]